MGEHVDAPNLEDVLQQLRSNRKNVSSAPLIQREFDLHQGPSLPLDRQNIVRVMQWNMLAQGLCRSSDGFLLCPDSALEMDYRKHLVIEELISYAPDVICLQEVDYFTYIQQQLLPLGYKGTFFPKPDSPCLYTPDNIGPDGCAVFWKDKHLSLVTVDNVNLKKGNGKVSNQVAVICRFKLITTSSDKEQEVVICTTHLKSKPPFYKQRLDQGLFLEQYLRERYDGKAPLIICGDFNAEPTEKVINVFKSSKLGLVSCYSELSGDGSEPGYTTWKVRGRVMDRQEIKTEVCHTIDYIFYMPSHMTCVSSLSIPTQQQIGDGFLPSLSYPSDHISLIADFQFKDSQ